MRQETRRLRPPRWPSGLVPWRTAVQSFLEKLSKAAKVQIEVLGATRSQSGEDLMLDLGTTPSGTATAQTPAQEAPRWPSGLVPWKLAVQAHAEKLAAAAGVQIEVFGTTRGQSGEQPALEVGTEFTYPSTHSTASKKDASVPRWPTSHVGWCRALQSFIERLASALQTSLELGGAARSSGGDKLVFVLKPPPPPPLILRLEVQTQQAVAFYCANIFDDDGNAYSSVSQTQNWDNGTITYTTSGGDPGPHISTPTIPRIDCVYGETTDDIDEDLDYGFFIDNDDPIYSGPLIANLRDFALEALELIGDPDPGVAFAITATADDDTIHAEAHGLSNGDLVVFPRLKTRTIDNSLTTDPNHAPYVVRDATSNTFKVSTTVEGSAVDITSDVTSGTCRKGDQTAIYRSWPKSAEPPTDIGPYSLGYWTRPSYPINTEFTADSRRYRWTNDSIYDLRITWTQGEEEHTVIVTADHSSDWYDDLLPDAPNENDTITEVEITVL